MRPGEESRLTRTELRDASTIRSTTLHWDFDEINQHSTLYHVRLWQHRLHLVNRLPRSRLRGRVNRRQPGEFLHRSSQTINRYFVVIICIIILYICTYIKLNYVSLRKGVDSPFECLNKLIKKKLLYIILTKAYI